MVRLIAYRHAQQSRLVVLEREVLVVEVLEPVDGGTTSTVTGHKVAALEHETGYDSVESSVLVALRLALVSFGLAGAELAEVLGGFGCVQGYGLVWVWKPRS